MNKVGRNDPCPCGSGKKYKQCCSSRDVAQKPQSSMPVEQMLQLAVDHHRSGRLPQAQALYHQILAIKPRHADALNLAGAVAGQGGNHAEAVELISKAIAINPRGIGYYRNLGLALQALGRFDEAAATYRRALTLEPNHAESLNGLGSSLQAKGDVEQAVACYQKVLKLQPNLIETWYNLGNAFGVLCRYDDAIASYNQALALKPDYAPAHNNLGIVLQELGNIEAATKCYRQAFKLGVNNADVHSNYLMLKQYALDYSAEELLDDHRDFADRFEAPWRKHWPAHANTRDPERPLKIGFMSGDFRNHPVGYFLENVLAQLDTQVLDITLYSTNLKTDEMTERLRQERRWVELAILSDEAAAQRIIDDGIDILVDLSGHTGGNRLPLLARKPAPVQVSWLGYWATTGLGAMDYFLCDRYGLLETEHVYFVERPWYLPETRLCFTPPDADVEVNALPALNSDTVTLGCFNNINKMGDTVVALWARILHEIPQSRLFLKNKPFDDAGIRETTLARFAAFGIGPERLLIEGRSPRADYLAAYHRVDIALDPFPFTGATTSSEGLWMGVPFVTRRGASLLQRQGESILRNLDMADWIAENDDAYLALVRARLADLPALAELRAGLRQRLLDSPLCDASRFARNLEAAFRGMWREYCGRH